MHHHKIVFTGPVGAGKTTAIRTLCGANALGTDAAASDMTRTRKETTTVALDYGTLHLNSGETIHVYGTPGQERFDFMWEILTQGGIGLVLLLDATRPAPLNDLRFFVNVFTAYVERTALAVGITRSDLAQSPLSLDDYAGALRSLDLVAPIFEVDARERRDISLLVQALLLQLDPGLAA
ncbi:GTP-binding protein [Plasticicumulans acidivorans]|uniref:GTP-binding protein n=1 Tax=Plasticicumulans acidivorans TaxID=886464 RepID=A0A317MV14_9GAMM|nr:ATP/GTP-binding protein [Plasticicumulans acidivorans]PWV61782.1 hypothetical protein C7443_105215 [Plasticicumulans acidivorans]